MPIFQDDLGGGHPSPPARAAVPNSPPDRNALARKLSEESIRTDLCEGPLLESPRYPEASVSPGARSEFGFPAHETSDRELLIERLKKGNNKTWWPNREVRMPRMPLFCQPQLNHSCSLNPCSLATTNKTLALLLKTPPICLLYFPRPNC